MEAARRDHLPWYARSHRKLLGLLPAPLGEDLTKVGYIEISAHRLAAQRAAAELDNFRSLPNIDPQKIIDARRTFVDWEKSAESRLEQLEKQADIGHGLLRRRQAQALSRITVREVLRDLVTTGVISSSVAHAAGERIVDEIGVL